MTIDDQNDPKNGDTISWLLAGDVAICYQTYRDLLGENRPDLQTRIATEGWGEKFLAAHNPDGFWGSGFYQPKWTSSHYTLLDLRTIEAPPDNELIRRAIDLIATTEKGVDGGVNPGKTIVLSDVCVNGMFLNYAAYFGEPEEELRSIVDFLIEQQMGDGGFNCHSNRSGARHSSLHSTISVLEGIQEYASNNYRYRVDELLEIAEESHEFILMHKLFRSDHTGEVIHENMLRLAFPPRWKYNILRALDYFRLAKIPFDPRMRDALAVLSDKRRPDGRWLLQAAHPGAVHFAMEQAREPSRWNTLLALRVLKTYGDNAGA